MHEASLRGHDRPSTVHPSLIVAEDLHRDFQMGPTTVHALDGVSMSVSEGEFLSVMGPSGSGKSTLLNLVGGLDRPTSGRIWVDDREITELDENELAEYRRRQVGFVFQSFNLVSTMTALENVAFPMFFARMSPARRRGRAQHLLEAVGLTERMDHQPTELSGGEQQRVAIARSLANDPTIVLADEPTGNLDSHTGAEVMEVLARLNREEGRTIIVVSHDPTVAGFVGRSIHLLDGKVVDGSDSV